MSYYEYENEEDWKKKSDYSSMISEINQLRGSFRRASKKVGELKSIIKEAYKDINQSRVCGDAGSWDETDLEKRLKKVNE